MLWLQCFTKRAVNFANTVKVVVVVVVVVVGL